MADPSRRKPRQARSRGTVEAIFEATAQILQREGPEALTTNRIAERAGVSIGSLYQYFPDKQSILVALAEREIDKTQMAVMAVIRTAPDATREERARLVIRALMTSLSGRHRVRRHLFDALAASGLHRELARPVQEIARAIAERGGAEIARRLAPEVAAAKLFVLTRAVVGVIRAAVLEDSSLFGTAALEDELVRLVVAYAAAASA